MLINLFLYTFLLHQHSNFQNHYNWRKSIENCVHGKRITSNIFPDNLLQTVDENCTVLSCSSCCNCQNRSTQSGQISLKLVCMNIKAFKARTFQVNFYIVFILQKNSYQTWTQLNKLIIIITFFCPSRLSIRTAYQCTLSFPKEMIISCWSGSPANRALSSREKFPLTVYSLNDTHFRR